MPVWWTPDLGEAVAQLRPDEGARGLLARLGLDAAAIERLEGPPACVLVAQGWMERREVAGAKGESLVLYACLGGPPWTAAWAAGARAPVAPPVGAFQQILGNSHAIREAKELAVRAARTQAPVLISGETGVGKELFARAVHELSPRALGPFVALNCAAIPDQLAEAELFGYDRGAFTGAHPGGRPGRFERADGGTLFLDEIGELPLALQAKLLRALQHSEVERLGGRRPIPVDVRVVSATNRDLRALVESGCFRADLFYRLNVLRLTVPPLRQRVDDLPLLMRHFLEAHCRQHGVLEKALSPSALQALCEYPWPGNVRELISCAQRLALLVPDRVIRIEHLVRVLGEAGGHAFSTAATIAPDVAEVAAPGSPVATRPAPAANPVPAPAVSGVEETPLADRRAQSERDAIAAALRRAGGNKREAARRLGIHRSTLYEKMRRYGLIE